MVLSLIPVARGRRAAMRISERILVGVCVSVAIFAMTKTYAFDGTATADGSTTPVTVATSPAGVPVLKKPTSPATVPQQTSLTSLQYAADDGHAAAQWKLGRMYAEGVDVPRDDLRAF